MRPNEFGSLARTLAPILLACALGERDLAQESAAIFDAPLAQLPQDSAPFRKLLDLNSDGYLDAIGCRMQVSSSGTGSAGLIQFTAWLNDQQGRFTQAYTQSWWADVGVPWTLTGGRLSVGHLDGNGVPDFVWCADQGGTQVWRFTSFPPGSIGFSRTPISIGQLVVDVELGDFDGDGDDDLAVLTTSTLQILWTGGGITQTPIALPCCATSANLLVVETDGDALPDLFIGGSAGGRACSIEAGALSLGPNFNLSYAPSMWTNGDVDGDGDADIVAFHAGTTTGVYQVLRRTGPSTFALEAPKFGGPAEYLADIDADGDLDGVCCGGGGCSLSASEWPKLNFNSRYEICVNDGSGTFSDSYSFWNVGSTSLAGAVDVDLDGDTDLVGGRTVYYGRGGLAQPFPMLAQGTDQQSLVHD
ncbi:MAG: VCBS repeat-containing protein [Planctomycetes bacterium]|nr:VCBS repeat-containing protein [Planctomycetota bacterium]